MNDYKYYLAGPMSGIAKHNIPAFDAAAIALRDRGYNIVSPAELDGGVFRKAALANSPNMAKGDTCVGKTYGDLLSRDMKMIADDIQGIILLPGWHKSTGARIEAYIGVLMGRTFGAYTHKKLVTPLTKEFVAGVLANELTNQFARS